MPLGGAGPAPPGHAGPRVLRHRLRLPARPGDAVPVAARAGSIVVFSSLTPHSTGPNRTGAVRKAYIVQFAPSGAEVHPPRARGSRCVSRPTTRAASTRSCAGASASRTRRPGRRCAAPARRAVGIAPSWAGRPPADDAEAGQRIREAARRCIDRNGVNVRIAEVAREAGRAAAPPFIGTIPAAGPYCGGRCGSRSIRSWPVSPPWMSTSVLRQPSSWRRLAACSSSGSCRDSQLRAS